MTNLPKHLQEKIAAYEAKQKAFGIVDMANLLQAQESSMSEDDFHQLHALARF